MYGGCDCCGACGTAAGVRGVLGVEERGSPSCDRCGVEVPDVEVLDTRVSDEGDADGDGRGLSFLYFSSNSSIGKPFFI